ncbi:HNH endonuclease family protein [Streptomyces sp. NPDC089919]|uniref:HNH endonuclease family protein n=1 Tax=Streptomyces sp. NPDC089919 TaxID=3155188 RepID=UPI00341E1BBD
MRPRRVLPVLLLAPVLALTGCTPSGAAAARPGGAAGPATPAGGEAYRAVDALAVKGRAPKTGYAREEFGSPWLDTDRNGCDTRDDILRRDLANALVKGDDCKVISGVLQKDPYTGARLAYERGQSVMDVDHVVALSDAWQKGARRWDEGKRIAFANDPLNLVAVDAAANRRKGDGDAASWLPHNREYRCPYVAAQVAVKKKYGLWVTAAERDAMRRILSGCPDQTLPAGGNPTRPPARFR